MPAAQTQAGAGQGECKLEADLCCIVKAYIKLSVVQVYNPCRQTLMAEDDAGPKTERLAKM